MNRIRDDTGTVSRVKTGCSTEEWSYKKSFDEVRLSMESIDYRTWTTTAAVTYAATHATLCRRRP